MGRFGHEFLGKLASHSVHRSFSLKKRKKKNKENTKAQENAEFDFRVVGDGRSAVARYANNSNYRNDSLIRKESMRPSMFSNIRVMCMYNYLLTRPVCVSSVIVEEIKRIIKASEIIK